MVLDTSCDPSGLVSVTLGAVITSRDQAQVIAFVRAGIEQVGSVRVLLKLEHYAGWFTDPAADPDSLWLRDDEGVSAIAIVGEAGWQREILGLLLQPLRSLPIQYFTSEPAAREWLTRSLATDRVAPSA